MNDKAGSVKAELIPFIERNWDKEKLYDEEIQPLMAQIIAICKAHEIPFLAAFAYLHDERGFGICRSSRLVGDEPDTFRFAHSELLKQPLPMAMYLVEMNLLKKKVEMEKSSPMCRNCGASVGADSQALESGCCSGDCVKEFERNRP